MGAKLAEERQLASQHQLALQAQVSEAQAHIKVHRIITHPEHDQTAMLFSAVQFKLSYSTSRISPFIQCHFTAAAFSLHTDLNVLAIIQKHIFFSSLNIPLYCLSLMSSVSGLSAEPEGRGDQTNEAGPAEGPESFHLSRERVTL